MNFFDACLDFARDVLIGGGDFDDQWVIAFFPDDSSRTLFCEGGTRALDAGIALVSQWGAVRYLVLHDLPAEEGDGVRLRVVDDEERSVRLFYTKDHTGTIVDLTLEDSDQPQPLSRPPQIWLH